MKLIRKTGTRLNKNGTKIRYGEFLCSIFDCGKIVERQISNGLKQKSCGCNISEIKKQKSNPNYKHGGKGTRLYNVWALIKQRCLNSKSFNYKDYGGRGITICDEWLEFIPFRDWSLSNGYAANLEIDRKNNNLGYNPENCHFVTGKENSNNRRPQKVKNKEIVLKILNLWNTKNYKRKELANLYNVSISTISNIINKNKGRKINE